jgi:hypothetical protein
MTLRRRILSVLLLCLCGTAVAKTSEQVNGGVSPNEIRVTLLGTGSACAMDTRGRGASGDSPEYGLSKEAEDVAAVVNSRPGPVFVSGHSYGGVAALEATTTPLCLCY